MVDPRSHRSRCDVHAATCCNRQTGFEDRAAEHITHEVHALAAGERLALLSKGLDLVFRSETIEPVLLDAHDSLLLESLPTLVGAGLNVEDTEGATVEVIRGWCAQGERKGSAAISHRFKPQSSGAGRSCQSPSGGFGTLRSQL